MGLNPTQGSQKMTVLSKLCCLFVVLLCCLAFLHLVIELHMYMYATIKPLFISEVWVD